MNVRLYCPRCGRAMSVARVHLRTLIGCPHCDHGFRPAAITPLSAAPAGRSVPGHPPVHPGSLRTLPTEARSRVAAGLLGIFLGCLGIHRFYLGYHGIGAVQLCLTLGGFLIPPVVCCAPLVAVWGFVEGVLCLAGRMNDAEGRPLEP